MKRHFHITTTHVLIGVITGSTGCIFPAIDDGLRDGAC